jgi:hypothetical protein
VASLGGLRIGPAAVRAWFVVRLSSWPGGYMREHESRLEVGA